jgi:hypothetical protein
MTAAQKKLNFGTNVLITLAQVQTKLLEFGTEYHGRFNV